MSTQAGSSASSPRAIKRIHEKLKAHGIDIWWIDCDGDVRPILPFMMEGGVTCLFPYEVNSCAHPAELLNEYGKDLRIMGGFDKIEMGKGREAIRPIWIPWCRWWSAAGTSPSATTAARPMCTRTITCITWI